MKYIIMTFGCALMLLMCGCQNFMFSHNENMFTKGLWFRLWVGDYGLTLGSGTLWVQAVRENTATEIQTDDGAEFGNPSALTKGNCVIRVKTGPQVTGYLKDLAEKDGEAAREYVKAMPHINNALWPSSQLAKADGKKEGSMSSTLDKAKEKVQDIMNQAKTTIELFTCNGNCTFDDLWKNNSIAYQTAVATKLLSYADDTAKMPGTGELLKSTLEHYLDRMKKLTANGKTETRLRIRSATVRDSKLTELMYRMIEPDGNTWDEECPNCVPLEVEE